jgi:hypothetical protein
MTYKVISTSYPSGYSLAAQYNGLLILSTGSIGGTGLKLSNAANVGNYGEVAADSQASNANNGITAEAGATIKNGSVAATFAGIQGYSGIFAQNAAATVRNYGGITGHGPGGDGVFIVAGGSVTNGAANDTSAVIVGAHSGVVANALASVVNFGRIQAFSQIYTTTEVDGVDLAAGGTIVNGSASDTIASVSGAVAGVVAGALTGIQNYGTIEGGEGVHLALGGTVTNGSTAAASAEIYGYFATGSAVIADKGSATIINFGVIKSKSEDGVVIHSGGVITNGDKDHTGALISGGYTGIVGGLLPTVVNFGTVRGLGVEGVYLEGGAVTNGSAADTAAEIYGKLVGIYLAGAGTIANFGQIRGATTYGVELRNGGLVTNGSGADRTALIDSAYAVAVYGSAGTVRNYGTIAGIGSGSVGVKLAAGGLLTNGTGTDTAAYIGGTAGVSLAAAGTVNNFGVIASHSLYAIKASALAIIANGSNTDTIAELEGARGVLLLGGGTVRNFGTIASSTNEAVFMTAGGVLANGSTSDLNAVIRGPFAVNADGATITNFATILSTAAHAAVYLSGGQLTNGSPTITSALISGGSSGLDAEASASVINLATIAGGAAAGVYLGNGCALVNGAAGVNSALVQGDAGVWATGTGATIENFGVIYGSHGVAVDLSGAGGVLEVEAGCAFYGAVLGGGGTLDLGSGSGTISSFAHGDAVVSGAIVPSSFSDFAAFEIGAAANFTLAGAGSLTAGRALTVDGSLTVAGTLSSAGFLAVTRTLTGVGTLALTAGSATFETGTVLTIARVTQSGGVANFAAASLTVSHPWTQTSGIVAVSAGDKVSFTGTGDTFSGTLTGTGAIAFTGGSDLLSGATLSAKTVTVTGAAVTLSGAISLFGALSVTSTNLVIATAGATLSRGGSLNLTNHASNAIEGAASTAILTNGDKITGAGTISNLVLVNQAGGVINGNQTTALIINTGASTIANAGLIENVGTGGTTIMSAVANTGTLLVAKGVLTASAAVSGAGIVKIGGGTADFASGFSENVTFTSTTGVLELAKSTTYTGSIAGFSKTGTTSFDLLDIASGTASASYSGTTVSGVLTVTDGTHTAKITLIGDYTASTFTPTSDGHGGTSVVDPTALSGRTPSLQPLIAAMAGFGSAGGQSTSAGALARGPTSWLVHAA